MDVSEYISSGIIELYATGVLPSEEMDEVERMASEYPGIAAELETIQNTLIDYSKANARMPRAELRAEILRRVETPARKSENIVDKEEEVHPHTISAKTYKRLMLACLASLILSTFSTIFFYKKWSETEDQFTDMRSTRDSLEKRYSMLLAEYDRTYIDMMLMHDENASIYTLLATDSTKKYKARVFWNKYTRQTYIDILSLPTLPPDHQYQLWAIVGDEPTDAGVFNNTSELGMKRLKNIANAENWTVTLEPIGGASRPDFDNAVLATETEAPAKPLPKKDPVNFHFLH